MSERTFVWEGLDAAGHKVRGESVAISVAFVRAMLRRHGIAAQRIAPKRTHSVGARIRQRDIALFTRQLAAMCRAGIPLLQAFAIAMHSSANGATQTLLARVRDDLTSGSSLNAALAHHPRHFDEVFCNLVHAGEQAGMLDSVLARLASDAEKRLAMRARLLAALLYPAMVLLVAGLITSGILVFVLPTFKDLYAGAGQRLPTLTLAVIAVSDFLVAWGHVLLAAMALGAFALVRGYTRSPHWRAVGDAWLLRLPFAGGVLRKVILARWARTVSALFSAGIPMVDALKTVARGLGNRVYEAATNHVATQVASGHALSQAMQEAGVFPAMHLQMTAIGEESGTLDAMLLKVAEYYEREVDDVVAGLGSLLEPALMVLLGVLVGVIVIAMYLPIFQMGTLV